MIDIKSLSVEPVSMVTKENMQKIVIRYKCSRTAHLLLSVYHDEKCIYGEIPVAFTSGEGITHILLPVPTKALNVVWKLYDKNKNFLAQTESIWEIPREWTFYVMISSHTDIGLHNSQYIQRYTCSEYIDEAVKCCDETADRNEYDRYRYTMEGTWFWNNYGMDRGEEAARRIADNYIKTDKIGLCCGVAGNFTQVYGLEEMCRSTYEKKRLYEKWNINSETAAFIDINGLSMSLIQPYCEAGYKNIIFSPNQWNPLPSTVWDMDWGYSGYLWNPNAGGGASRIDLRYKSDLPMVFFWEDENGNRILVCGCSEYGNGGNELGLYNTWSYYKASIPLMEQRISEFLPLLEEKCPYDMWLITCYGDDEKPNMFLTDLIKQWNDAWQWPKIRTLGNPDHTLEKFREKFGDKIPVLKGDITGGWYQSPLTTPELLSEKFEADRLLPTAEKWSVIAAMLDNNYKYPTTDFNRAWDGLLFNDEHSYGTSGYKGRRVYETWMQHRDWINKAQKIARKEINGALNCICEKIPCDAEKYAVFNQMLSKRTELIETVDGCCLVTVPSMGYRVISKEELNTKKTVKKDCKTAPVIENQYYKIIFKDNGAVSSIYDKQLKREILDKANRYGANELIYTNDNHKTFYVPQNADFEIEESEFKTTLKVKTAVEHLGSEIVQTIILPHFEKRIDFDNRIYHPTDLVNTNRYYRYLYFAFPFMVENSRRYCHLNGVVAEYAKTVTGHGTDVYMAVNEWCCSQNSEFGVALITKDSQLMEFDHIHPDKTDFDNAGEGSQIFAYVANDWLQMHTAGGSHLNYVFRYSIVSYAGDYIRAKIPQIAERFMNPVDVKSVSGKSGELDSVSQSFLSCDADLRLLTLKRADNGNGIIARLYGNDVDVCFESSLISNLKIERNTVDEKTCGFKKCNGFITYRIGEDNLFIKERHQLDCKSEKGKPLPIGSVYTGLITDPVAACGENDGQLYLLWGQNTEDDLSHYKLFRSEKSGFKADDTTFIANVEPEKYRVARYVDTGLKNHTRYYYRVCAVNKNGIAGDLSDEFFGFTRETV